MKRLLRIDASARREGSVTRQLGDEFQARWLARHPGAEIQVRDLSESLPLLDSEWVAANLTEPEQRTSGQQAMLALSDRLIAELDQADAVLVTVPLYNFGVPAAMKAWIDLVCRARETFAYTEEGPRGLLADRPVYVVMATGGVPVGSPVDFASGYLKHVFGFIGLQDVHLIAAAQMNLDAEGALARARAELDSLFDTEGNDAAA
jgi:FMN-dependent NADH-azoreductase